jgi:two-component system sensor histidine kinase SenX3
MLSMTTSGNRRSVYFFTILGICLVLLAVALNIGWIVFHWRQVAMLVLGVSFFLLIIAGLVLNTIYLVREIRRNEQHDSFINAVTHELKTPIASIRLYLETLQKHDLSEVKRQEFYQVMLHENDRLLHTVEQVLRASRTGHRSRALTRTTIDLEQLARDCTELARQRLNLPPEALRFLARSSTTPPAPLALVKGDADELRAAISNLIDNAIKYSPEKIEVQVEVLTPVEEETVLVRVLDHGIGIPRNELKQIFKRFHRVPRRVVNRIKGTGLGLFIVRSVITKHGGKVTAESLGEGLGSTFTLILPRVSTPVEPSPAASA